MICFVKRIYPRDGSALSGKAYGEPLLAKTTVMARGPDGGPPQQAFLLEDGSIELGADLVALGERTQEELWAARVNPKTRRLPGGTPVTPAGQRDFMCIMLDALLDKTIDDEIKDRAKKLIDKLRDNEI
jgi:hypothetical protein